MKPLLLDLFCCAGGAAEGYHRAGFDVVGVDKEPQPNYPYKFIQADAIEYCLKYSHLYKAVHASPPCQQYSLSTNQHRAKGKQYPDLVAPTRYALIKSGKPWVMENVPGAPMRADITLNGTSFGLRVLRNRIFELGHFHVPQPFVPKQEGTTITGDYVTCIGQGAWKQHRHQRNNPEFKYPWFAKGTVRETWQYAMGIEHYMKDHEISESIPPAYTHYIGIYLMKYLEQ